MKSVVSFLLVWWSFLSGFLFQPLQRLCADSVSGLDGGGSFTIKELEARRQLGKSLDSFKNMIVDSLLFSSLTKQLKVRLKYKEEMQAGIK